MEHRLFDLTGQTALVTGAAGGIGSAICHALARQGARLALSGTNAAKLRAFREDLNDTYGHETGDRSLRLFSQVLRECVRARIGGGGVW